MGMLRRPCSNCGRPARVSPCAACKDTSHHGGQSRASRGYDAVYDRNAAEVRRRVNLTLAAGRIPHCVICRKGIGTNERLTVEHIIPLRNGGTNALRNLGPAHARCNYGWRNQG